ncbi:MAG: signal recognition particle-docking protein FtsY [Acidobacteriota bacterium]
MSEKLELPAETSAPAAPEPGGFWKKLTRGLLMTHTELLDRVSAAVEGRAVLDEATIEHLEEALIGADLGVDAALELVARIRKLAPKGDASLERLRAMLTQEMSAMLVEASAGAKAIAKPSVVLVVGVNGVGKTTSIAKLARRFQSAGETVLMGAADTFRAAASEQLALWGQRLDVEVVRQAAGSDPASVVFDALQAARSRQVDHVIVDTAGRLHTKDHLMAELAKMSRVIEREAPERKRFTLLVLDATNGQNAVTQAREFTRTVTVDGVLLSKLDGTAKGGVAVAIARELRLPVLYLGIGEGADDLVDFRPREFAAALLG